MTTHWKAVLGVILIFLFGVFSGVLGTAIIAQHKITAFLQHPGKAVAAAMEKRLTRNLHLDENQKQQIHGYFMENVNQRIELQKQIQPQIRMLNLATFQEIESVLRPDQQALFQKNIQEMRHRAAANGINPGPDQSTTTTPIGAPNPGQ